MKAWPEEHPDEWRLYHRYHAHPINYDRHDTAIVVAGAIFGGLTSLFAVIGVINTLSAIFG